MKDLHAKHSVFQFEYFDPSIQECRPLVDPLPNVQGKAPFPTQRIAINPEQSRPVNAWKMETTCKPTLIAFAHRMKTSGCELKIPAGSPSFARRPISNGHFQRGDQFKPSIQICQPPGGFDRKDW